MFVREVVTGQREGRPVRYAQIVSSYRNAQGKPRHRVVLALGRVDRLDRALLRDMVRALARYLGDDENLVRPRVEEVRELGLPWAVHSVWKRLSLPDHLALEARRHGLAPETEHVLFAQVLRTVACGGDAARADRWLRCEAYAKTPDGWTIPHDGDADELLAQAGPELERTLFLRRSIADGRLHAASLDLPSELPRCAVACDANGVPLATQVARGADALGRRLHRRLREMGAREVLWGRDEEGGEVFPSPVHRTVGRVRRAVGASVGTGSVDVEGTRARLTAALLAALVVRQLELDTGLPFEAVRERLRRLHAVALHDGCTTRWESAAPSPEASEVLRAVGLDAVPRVLCG
ncbi:MAG: hypothetical protein ACODAU_01985 [Myxococcota bacterium]